ncbi:MAG: right-handed parallel beta-helix repeat-containing protein [Luteolibacter sp.]|jgi:hypothetical protein|nr:right-handed parallel beta-helix repeat-containing protein [Luteolibacter sp.]
MKTHVALALCLTGMSWSVSAAEWHVNPTAATGGDGSQARPFSSLAETLAALPGGPAEPLTVRLAVGTYRIGSALEITAAHTRGQPLVFNGAGKARISGGKIISPHRASSGWRLDIKGKAPRELFANGERRPRARFPKVGWLRVAEALPDKRGGFIAQADLPPVGTQAELLFLHDWSVSRIPVKSIRGAELRTSGPIGFPAAHYVIDHYEPHPRFCLENDILLLTEKGTWCADKDGQVFYLPRDGETFENTLIEIPVADKLLRVSGTAEKPVRDVRFEGITFEHCRWDVPPSGYAEGQATKHVPRDVSEVAGEPHGNWQFVPWAVEVEHAESVVFRMCRFRNLGGGGVLLGRATRSCVLDRCQVVEVSGNGIGIGEGGERRVDGKPWWQAAPAEAAAGNRVERCLIERCGAQFHGAVGLWVGLAKDSRIQGNEVRHLPYTGISVGWMWNPTPTPCGGNLVEGNHIHHVMQLLSDGGGIYTLGRQPGTLLRDNLIHDIPLNAGLAESNGMFFDQGSSELRIENNLISSTDRSPLRFHKAGRIVVAGNRWVLPENIPALRFNNTPREVIEVGENPVLGKQEMAALAAEWRTKHPAPEVK